VFYYVIQCGTAAGSMGAAEDWSEQAAVAGGGGWRNIVASEAMSVFWMYDLLNLRWKSP